MATMKTVRINSYGGPEVLVYQDAPVWGIVEEVGSGLTETKTGEAVYALADLTRDGAYAEYIAVEASKVLTKLTSVDHVQAAAVPLAALTAWQALLELRTVGAVFLIVGVVLSQLY